jgi:protoheme IX farnesyltransferase
VNLLTGLVAAATLGIYLFAYTPLKRKTPFNTAVGAVAGALPPVGGWTAASGDLSSGAAVLFAILFLWQFPHVLAITWLHREDYGRGGYRMLAVMDADGVRTGRRIAIYSVCLLLLSLTPPLLGMAGILYLVAAVALGSAFLAAGLRFWKAPDRRRARTVMLASLTYLPLLWLLLLVDRP